MDKTGRNGLRVGDLLDKSFTTQYIRLRLKHQKLLDSLNFHEDISAWEEEFFEALEFMKEFKIDLHNSIMGTARKIAYELFVSFLNLNWVEHRFLQLLLRNSRLAQNWSLVKFFLLHYNLSYASYFSAIFSPFNGQTA